MLHRSIALAVTLTTAAVWSPAAAARAQSTQVLLSWQRTDSQHFEIHYLPALAPELDRIVRSAERAYDRISAQLDFVLPTNVPLVMFTLAGPMTPQEIGRFTSTARSYAGSDRVAPPSPHRSRLVLPLPERDAQLDAMLVHELTHLLVSGLVWQDRIGDGGLPHWIKEGVADHMVGLWLDEDEHLMRELVASRDVPALSQLSGSGGFTNARVNHAIGHAAFDYIESRWGSNGIRLFLDAVILPRVNKTYDAVFDLTPEDFDIAFREYAVRRFGQGAR